MINRNVRMATYYTKIVRCVAAGRAVLIEGGIKKHQCLSCGKAYKHKHILTRHQKFECGDFWPFCCDFCPFKTKQKQNLKHHVFNKHKTVVT